MEHQGHPEDIGLVPMCQRKVEDSGRTQPAQPDVTQEKICIQGYVILSQKQGP